MKKRRPDSGLTLIEVLVAISLLSLLSVSILTALRVGTAAWESANRNLMLDRRIATANAIFHAELEGVFPAWAEFENPATRTQETFLFFEGRPQSMRFVTSYSLEGGPRSGLRIVELQVVPGPKGRRVLLNEQPYSPRGAGRLINAVIRDRSASGITLQFLPILAQASSFVIADELEGCAFSYLGENMPNEPQRWTPVWPEVYRLPSAVSIQLAPKQNSPRLQPVTVTVPIRSTMLSP